MKERLDSTPNEELYPNREDSAPEEPKSDFKVTQNQTQDQDIKEADVKVSGISNQIKKAHLKLIEARKIPVLLERNEQVNRLTKEIERVLCGNLINIATTNNQSSINYWSIDARLNHQRAQKQDA